LMKVKPQVGATENAFAVNNNFGLVGETAGTIQQCAIEITEYNTFGEDVPTIGR